MKSHMMAFHLSEHIVLSLHFNLREWGIGIEYRDVPILKRKAHLICSNIFLGPLRICFFVRRGSMKSRVDF